MRLKRSISYTVSHNYGKVNIDLVDDLALKLINTSECHHTKPYSG